MNVPRSLTGTGLEDDAVLGGNDMAHNTEAEPETDTEEATPPKVDDDDAYEPAPLPFRVIVLLEAALVPGALLLGWLLGQHPLDQFSWDASGRALLIGAVATLPMFAMLGATVRWPYGPLRRIKDFFDEELRPALAGARPHDLVLLSLAAGLGEEMLFRGALQGAAVGWFGPALGVLAASALFGLLHPVSPAYVVLAAILGAYLGAILYFEGNLLTVVVAHALYDFIALTLLLRREDEDAPPTVPLV